MMPTPYIKRCSLIDTFIDRLNYECSSARRRGDDYRRGLDCRCLRRAEQDRVDDIAVDIPMMASDIAHRAHAIRYQLKLVALDFV